jgi:iron complex outermembrane receptor protein
LRYDHYNDFGSTLNPRLAMVWGVTDRINLKFLYGEAFRAPSLVELYGYTGNENLTDEEVKTYEAGIDFYLNSRFSLGVNYFYSRIEDIITQTRIGLKDYFENSDVLKTQGVELQIKGEYGNGNYWQIGYTYQDPRLGSERQRSAGIPYHQATLSANYKILPWLNSHLDILWMGERPRENGDDRADLDSYTTVDISLLTGKWQGLEFQGSIHNLFDTHYDDPDESGSARIIQDDYPREGISCLFTVRYSF